MMRSISCYFLSLLLTLFLCESVISQPTLQVQLLRYENPLNLELRPDDPNGPFCCCNMPTPCFPSMGNFSATTCTVQCGLRISICIQNPTSSESCVVSAIELSPALVDFTTTAPLFQNEPSRPLVNFNLDESFTTEFNLTVRLEEDGISGFELIDMVIVTIGPCNLSSPAMAYPGINGIATVTLAYVIATTTDRYRNCIEPNVVTVTNVETQTETQTERFTETERVTLRTTITDEVLVATVDPLAVESTEDSTSPWQPVAIVLIVIFGLAIVVVIVIALAAVYIWTRKSRKTKEVTSYNPVNEEAGVSPPPKQDLAGDEVVPGIFTNLSEEVLAAVPSLDEIHTANRDVDSFTSEPEQSGEEPTSAQVDEPHKTQAEVHTEENGQTDNQDSSEGLYAFEK